MRIILSYYLKALGLNLKANIFAIYISFTAVLLFGCGQPAIETQSMNEVFPNTPGLIRKEIKILATTPMVADWVNQVSGTRISVDSIIPYAVSPHSHQPGAKDVAAISVSQYIFAVGLLYEDAWLTKFLDSHKEIRVVNLGDYISPLEFGGHQGHGHDSDVRKYDPHFWFDPLRVSQVISTISDFLSNIDPEGASYYKTRAKDYQSDLVALDTNVFKELGKIPKTKQKLMSEHESLGYLGDRYDLQIFRAVIPNFTSETGPTPRDLAAVIDLIKEHDIQVIFLENESSEQFSERVAEETGIKMATGLSVETLTDGQTYVDFVNHNIQIIVSNLIN